MQVPRFVTHWMPALGWMILIFVGSTDVLSAQQTSRFIVPFLRWLDPHLSWAAINAIHAVIRKLGHVSEYAILAGLLWRALRGGKTFQDRIWLVFGVVWFASVLFAASDEFHQSFVPSRTPAVHDVMIDACGALIGLLLCLRFVLRRVPQELRVDRTAKRVRL